MSLGYSFPAGNDISMLLLSTEWFIVVWQLLPNTEWFIAQEPTSLETHMIILKDPTEAPIQSTDTHFQRQLYPRTR